MTTFVKDAFEQLLTETLEVEHTIAVNSGTSALIAALYSLDLKPGDEVITTPFTFQATINAIIIAGGTPVFADIEDDYLLDPTQVRLSMTDRTKAILPVNLFGQICRIEAIKDCIVNTDILIIEDCAQSFGLETVMSDVQCYSFYKTKNLSTFEGGAITFPKGSRMDHDKIRAICDNGQTSKYKHDYIGFNFRMSDLSALVGIERLKMHKTAIISELGMYGPADGHYPLLAYQQEAIRRLNYYGNCPNAERLCGMVPK